MTQNIPHPAHASGEQNRPNRWKAREQVLHGADSILRDIAFVLKMTQRVREEMEAEQDIEDAVVA
ncbi:MAG: hypothetical protein HYR84_01405 [Planctomycetes bacterium]|nr:hypothetical protein [Planctomycetota bacterium]